VGSGDGVVNLTATVFDKADNFGNLSVSLVLDNTKPTINSFYSDASFNTTPSWIINNFFLNTTDLNGVNNTYIINLTNPLIFNPLNYLWNNTYTSSELGSIGEGTFTITTYSIDNAENNNTFQYNLTIDDTAPIISNITSDASYNITRSDANINITATVKENVSIINVVRIRCDNNSYVLMNYSGSDIFYIYTNLTSLNCTTDGLHIINVTANNTASLEITRSYNITIDDTPPNMTGVYFNDSIINSNKFQEYQINNTEINFLKIEIYTNESDVKFTQTNQYISHIFNLSMLNFTIDTSYNQNITIYATITDKADNNNTINTSLILDNTPPTINNYTIGPLGFGEPPNVVYSDVLNYTVNTSDTNGVMNVNLTVLETSLIEYTRPENYTAPNSSYIILNNTFDSVYFGNSTPDNFNATFGVYNFNVKVTDEADNSIDQNITLRVTPGQIIINSMDIVSSPLYEVNAKDENYVQFRLNITELPEYAFEMTFNTSGKINQINLSADNFTSTDGLGTYIYFYNYTPIYGGLTDVTLFVKAKYTLAIQTNLSFFEAIPKSYGSLNLTTENSTEIYNITKDSTVTIYLNVSGTNDGPANMYDTTLFVPGGNGLISNMSIEEDCSSMQGDNETCTKSAMITITQNAPIGINPIYSIFKWINPDNTLSSILFPDLFINIHPNPYLKVLNDNVIGDSYTKTKTLLGSIELESYGNIELKNITFIPSTGLENLEFLPLSISSLKPGETIKVNVTINNSIKGNYSGKITINTTGNSDCLDVKDQCIHTINISTTTYEIINITNNLIDGTIINQSISNLELSCTANLFNPSINNSVSVDFLLDQNVIGTSNTNVLGKAYHDLDLSSIDEAGYHNITCRISDQGFYKVEIPPFDEDTKELLIIGNITSLNVTRTKNLDEIYWYDSHPESYTELTITTLNDFNNPIVGANVSIFSNTTPSFTWQKIGNCTTGPTGSCLFNLNPDVTNPGTFSYYVTANKDNYYSQSTINYTLEVIGGLSSFINNPLADYKAYQLEILLLNGTILSNGEDSTKLLNYSYSWKILNEDYSTNTTIRPFAVKIPGTGLNDTWNITREYLGPMIVELNITTLTSSETHHINITINRNDTNITSIYSNTSIIDKDETLTTPLSTDYLYNLTLTISDSQKPIENANVTFFYNDYENNITIANTDQYGNVTLLWNPGSEMEPGQVEIYANITKEYYDPLTTYISVFDLIGIPKIRWEDEFTTSYAVNFNDFKPLNLSCDMKEYINNYPINSYPANIYLLEPSILEKAKITPTEKILTDLNGTQNITAITWQKNDTNGEINTTDNIVITAYPNQNFTIKITNLNLDAYEDFSSRINNSQNLLITIDLIGNDTRRIQTTQKEGISSENIQDITVDEIYITLTNNRSENSTVIISEILFKDKTYSLYSKLGYMNTYFASHQHFADQGDDSNEGYFEGSFENIEFNPSPYLGNIFLIDPGYEGWTSNVNLELTNETIFGNWAANMSFNSLSTGESAQLTWLYSDGSSKVSLENYESLNFYMKSDDPNLEVWIGIGNTTQIEYKKSEIKRLEGKWSYNSINLEEYTFNISHMNRFNINITNTDANPATNDILIDEIRLSERTISDNEGHTRFTYYPSYSGTYTFGCEIQNEHAYYKISDISTNFITKTIQVLTSEEDISTEISEGEDISGLSEDSDDVKTGGLVTSFSAIPLNLNLVVPYDATGTYEDIIITSNIQDELNLEIQLFSNIFSLEEGTKTNKTVISLRSKEQTNLKLYINSSIENKTTPYKNYVAITSTDTKERLVLELTLNFINLSGSIITPTISNNLTEVLEDDPINITLDISYNGSDNLIQNLTFLAEIEEEYCEVISKTIGTTQNITCLAPLPENNPILTSLTVLIDTSSIKGNEQTTYIGTKEFKSPDSIIYQDVLGPTYNTFEINNSFYNLSRDITSNITDNTQVLYVDTQIIPYEESNNITQFLTGQNISINLNATYKTTDLFTIPANVTITSAKVTLESLTALENLQATLNSMKLFNCFNLLGNLSTFKYDGSDVQNILISEPEKITIEIPKYARILNSSISIMPYESNNFQFNDISSIDSDQSHIYLLDKGSKLIYIYNNDTTYNKTLGYTSDLSINQPLKIKVENEIIYLSDTNNNRIIKISNVFNGETKETLIKASAALSYPSGMDINGDQLSILDTNNNKIAFYNLTSHQLDRVENYGTERLNLPSDIEVQNNNLFILEPSSDSIIKYSYDSDSLTFVATLTNTSLYNNNFSNPQDIEIVGSTLFVADTDNERIQMFDSDTLDFEKSLVLPPGTMPKSISAIDQLLYIYDSASKRILVYNKEGVEYDYLTTINQVIDNLYPRDLIIDIGSDTYFNVLNNIQNEEYYNEGIINESEKIYFVESLQEQIGKCENPSTKPNYCLIDADIRYTKPGKINLNLSIQYTIRKEVDIAQTLNEIISDESPTTIGLNGKSDMEGQILLSNLSITYYNNNEKIMLLNQSDIYSTNMSALIEYERYMLIVDSRDIFNHTSILSRIITNFNKTTFTNDFSLDPEDDYGVNIRFIDSYDVLNEILYNGSATSTNGLIETEISDMSYDVQITSDYLPENYYVSPDYNQITFLFHNLTFLKLNNTGSVNNTFKIKTIDFQELEFPENSKTYEGLGEILFGGMTIRTSNITFQSVDVTFNYSSMRSFIESQGLTYDPNDLNIYKCSKDDISLCNITDWKILPTTIDNEKTSATASSNSTSTYILLEVILESIAEGESTTSPEGSSTDPGSSSGDTTSSTNTAGSTTPTSSISMSSSKTDSEDEEEQYKSISFCGNNLCEIEMGENEETCKIDCLPTIRLLFSCGNDICDVGENPENCVADCDNLPFDIDTNINSLNIFPGREKEAYLKITNLVNYSLTINMNVTPNTLDKIFANLKGSININPNMEKEIRFNLSVDNLNSSRYYGELLISQRDSKKIESIKINILDPLKQYLSLESGMSTRKIDYGLNPELILDFNNHLELEGKTDLKIKITNLETKEEIYNEDLNVELQPSKFSLSKMFNDTFERGNYMIEATNDEFGAFASTYFSIIKPFWTPQKINFTIFLIIGIIAAIALIIGGMQYKKYLHNKIRYITPKFDLVPEESPDHFYLGKVAGSDGVKS
ncbi:hypothetical protein C0585_02715, partial [Candidatus Woesearchaeota archaeon]